MKLEDILLMVRDTDELLIGSGMLNESGAYFRKFWGGSGAILVADSTTWKVAGETVYQSLLSADIPILKSVIFEIPPLLHADYSNVERIKKEAEPYPEAVLIAVGSGTINDLVKTASFERGCSYMAVGTAASMDGYCSAGASLSVNGRKQTVDCAAPKVIIADTDILQAAPAKYTAAGYGDLASKLTAGADWIIADFTGDDPIEKHAWNIIQPPLADWLSEPEKLAAGDPQKVAGVFEGLNCGGLAMQALGRSRAASGAEHMFSHIWDMSGHRGADGNPVSHGFQVSLGIICVTALMEEVFKMEAENIDISRAVGLYPSWTERSKQIEEVMKELPAWKEYIDICSKKHLSREQLAERLNHLKEGWNTLRERVWAKLPRYPEMRKMLDLAGCPVKPEDINLSRENVVQTYWKTLCMRNRYTILDLAFELGIFSECVENIEQSDKYLN
jgi:glycerol-1-phosphate dehydrogenase [NAD(P)+]